MLKPKNISRFLALTLALTLPSAATASDILQIVTETSRGQTNQTQPVSIPLAKGYGITLSFLQSQQVVTKAWLDNPSFVTVDGDGCLVVAQGQGCTGSTKVLHLKRINDLSIPGLPNTYSTLLTLLTQDAQGGGIYFFRVVKANHPQKLIYEIVPATPATVQPLSEEALAQQLERGITKAKKLNLLGRSPQLETRLQQTLQLLKSGQPLPDAITQSGLSWDLAGQILHLGQEEKHR